MGRGAHFASSTLLFSLLYVSVALRWLTVCRKSFSFQFSSIFFFTAGLSSFLPSLPHPSSLPNLLPYPPIPSVKDRNEIHYGLERFFFLSFLSLTRCCMSYCFHLTECWSKYLQEQTNMSLQGWILVCCFVIFIYCDSILKWILCYYRVRNCKMTVHTEQKSVNKLNSNELTCRKSILP